ncbi:MAG TPA: hypothetical protein VFW71_09510 [Actinomycetota bacterium]|nr:hypothetical protein [Actinomycetota bacterium]
MTALCVLPFLLLVAFIERRAVNIPYSDEWDLVPLLRKQALGTLRLSDVWAQHNEHRDFFPQLILLKLARLTHWDLRWELVVNVVLAVAMLAVLLLLVRRVLRPLGVGPCAVGAVAAAWLFFSPMQWENWLSGWQVGWFLAYGAAVGAIALLALWPAGRPAGIPVVGAIVLGVIASYSLASGLFVWPAALCVFVVQPRYRRWLWAWVGAGLVTAALYLRGYHSPAGAPPLTAGLHHPGNFVLYLLAYFGTPLWGRRAGAVLVGLGVVVGFAVALRYLVRGDRQALRDAAAWVGLAVFALLAALETAVGRVGFGATQATTSRYTTAALLFIVVTVVFGILAFHTWASREHSPAASGGRVGAVLVMIVVAAILRSYSSGISGSRVYRSYELAGRACMATATPTDHACLAILVRPPDYVYQQLTYLRAARLDGQHPIPGG